MAGAPHKAGFFSWHELNTTDMLPRGLIPLLLFMLAGCGRATRVVRLDTGQGKLLIPGLKHLIARRDGSIVTLVPQTNEPWLTQPNGAHDGVG